MIPEDNGQERGVRGFKNVFIYIDNIIICGRNKKEPQKTERGSEQVCVCFQLGEVCIALVSTIDEDKPFQIDGCKQSVYSCYLKLREVPSGILVLNIKCIRTTSFPCRKRSGSYCGSLEKVVLLSDMEVFYTDN